MKRKQQEALELHYPERFEGADDWITLAGAAFAVVGLKVGEPWKRFAALHEELRLRAKYASLAGQEAVRAVRDAYAIELRAQRTPVGVAKHKAALYILDTYLRAPDKRSELRRMVRDLNLLPKPAVRRRR